jgi:hypothetical protein
LQLYRAAFFFADGSMTKSGVPKPVWRAFQLLHTHAGDHKANTTVVQQTPVDALVSTLPLQLVLPLLLLLLLMMMMMLMMMML